MDDLEEKRLAVVESFKETNGRASWGPQSQSLCGRPEELLSKGTIVEQKSFLAHSSNASRRTIPTLPSSTLSPLNAQKVEPLTREVLPFEARGSPGRTRTSDQLVNSQPLYRLSYRGIVPDIIPYSHDSSRVKCQLLRQYPGIDSPYSTARDGCENCKKVLGFAAREPLWTER